MESSSSRRLRGEAWAKLTRKGPGSPRYVSAYMHGYFNHLEVSAKPLNSAILEQFEEVNDNIEFVKDLIQKRIPHASQDKKQVYEEIYRLLNGERFV